MVVFQVGECTFNLTFNTREMEFLKQVDVCDTNTRDMTLELLQAMIMFRVLFLLGGNVTGIGTLTEVINDGT